MRTNGFIKPIIDRTHYILGGSVSTLPAKVIRPDGDWSRSLPSGEIQRIPAFDTYNCTGFGTTNLIEVYMKEVFGIDENYSDRDVGIIAKTTPPGNDPHTVMQAIRDNGLIKESLLPFDPTLQNAQEYFSYKGADEEACKKARQEWHDKYDFKHEWVFTPTENPEEEEIHNMKVALKYSPLGVSVYAWQQDGRGYYVSAGEPNHWTVIYKYEDIKKVFDTYEPFLKDIDQPIWFCKRISIELKNPIDNKPDLFTQFIEWLKRQIKFFYVKK